MFKNCMCCGEVIEVSTNLKKYCFKCAYKRKVLQNKESHYKRYEEKKQAEAVAKMNEKYNNNSLVKVAIYCRNHGITYRDYQASEYPVKIERRW